MRNLLHIVLLFFPAFVWGQTAEQNFSTEHAIFSLTNEQTKALLLNEKELDSTFFSTMVTKYNPKLFFQNNGLPHGNYLDVSIDKTDMVIEFFSVQNITPFIINNSTDFLIEVQDKAGNNISNSTILLNKKQLKYHANLQAYKIKKNNKDGLIIITHEGVENYYLLDRKFKRGNFRRVGGKILYGTPIKFIARPIRYVIHIPIDGYKSIKHNHVQGSIKKTIKPVQDIVHSFQYDEPHGWIQDVACFFAKDAFYCDDDYRDKYAGYLTFSQPRYRPEDSIHFKTFIVRNKNGKPINDSVDVYIGEDYYSSKVKKIATIAPYTAGGYTYNFTIHDSMNLKLDKNIHLILRDKNGDNYMRKSFKYEDYDLLNNEFTLSANKKALDNEDSLVLTLKAMDENELALFDIEYDLEITTNRSSNHGLDYVFTPKLLYQKTGVFSDTALVNVPMSIFSEADITAIATVKFKDAANEYQNRQVNLTYDYSVEGIKHSFDKGVLQVKFMEKGNSVPKSAEFIELDRFDFELSSKQITLPYTHQINTMAAEYAVVINGKAEYITTNSNSQLSVSGYNQRDTAYISTINPNQIPFQYFIYRGNGLVKEGFTTKLDTIVKAGVKTAVTIITNHVWQGANHTNKYQIKQYKNRASITVDAPGVIYPGQEVNITVAAKDVANKPIANMDVTAQAYTSSFKSAKPSTPYFPSPTKSKWVINEFTLNEVDQFSTNQSFTYNKWKAIFGLDSLAYYTFRNPTKAITQHFTATKDSVTQFAPVIVKDGQIQRTAIVELNKVPVYFDFVDHKLPYSFKVKSGKPQHIYIRLANASFSLDSVVFKPYGKTLLVIDLDKLPTNKVIKEEPELNKYHLNKYRPYLFSYRGIKRSFGFPTLQQGNNIFILSNSTRSTILTGPILPHNFEFNSAQVNYSLDHEAGFEYEFLDELVKMREREKLKSVTLTNMLETLPLHHRVLTTDSLAALQKKVNVARIRRTSFIGTNSLKNGDANLIVNYGKAFNNENILYTLFYKSESDTSNLFLKGGLHTKFYNIRPGTYKLFYLTDSTVYQPNVQIKLQDNGENYYKINELVPAIDIVADKVQKLIQLFSKDGDLTYNEQFYIEDVAKNSSVKYQYTGPTREIKGRVLDDNGDAVLGATVRVPGTSVGAITDIDGYYTIKIPTGSNELSISFIGMQPINQVISNENNLETMLTNDSTMLDEVVVTSYGINRESKTLSYAVSTIDDDGFVAALAGKVAGITILNGSGQLGAAETVRLRGTSDLSGDSQPLYVIDGVIYNGNLADLESKDFASISTLKGSESIAIYGARATNGVIVITTTGGISELGLPGNFEELPAPPKPQPQLKSSLRDNFSDTGFWQPKLTTNKAGEATFTVTFPDDVTKWDAHFLAMNGKKQTGSHHTSIKSYKPVLAQLHAPRFLNAGDRINIVGELSNYTPDTLMGQVNFITDSTNNVLSKSITLKEHNKYNVELNPQRQDSLTMKFTLDVPSLEYMDGEKRKIPVNKKGTEESKGQFFNLYQDSTIVLKNFPENTPVLLQASSNTLQIAEQEVHYLKNYKHFCNEQLASKLHAYLFDRRITKLKGEEYIHNADINKIIARLEKGRNDQQIWGWWPGNEFTPWINQHVISALILAKEQGFAIPDLSQAQDAMVFELEKLNNNPRRVLTVLETLNYLDIPINYERYLDSLVVDTNQYENRIKKEYLRKTVSLPYNDSLITKLTERDMLGNYKLKIPPKARYWYYPGSREFELNLYGYQLTDDKRLKHGMLSHLLSQRQGRHFQNTYQSSLMLNLLEQSGRQDILKNEETQLLINGAINETITNFPFEETVNNINNTSISKTGSNDVYVSASYKQWIDQPKAVDSLFKVISHFEDEDGNKLTSLIEGEKAYLKINVEALYDAKYVMLSIPIPSSCIYGRKKRTWGENYREHYKDETLIFLENFQQGERQFTIELLPKFTGNFTLNPAKAELMYAPTKFGRNALSTINVDKSEKRQ